MAEPFDRVAAEAWFLKHGLPSVLTPRARWRRLWRRSAPALVAWSTIAVSATVIEIATGDSRVDIEGTPTPIQWFILIVLLLIIPVALLVGWLASRIASPRGRRIASSASTVVAFASVLSYGTWAGRIEDAVVIALGIALILALNGIGVGSVLCWAVRLTLSNLASLGTLSARVLPVVLLTVLVFFNGFVWSMATRISRERMWLVIGFMLLIAAAFLVTGLVERVRPILASGTAPDDDAESLAGTPFSAMDDPVAGDPPSRGERANVMFVVAASQITQIAMVALVTAGIFLTLGLLVLSPQILATWTNNGPDQGTVFGMILPIPQPLIHVAMFQGALTFMYVSARSVGDGEYRKEFLDPLVDQLRVTLLARTRYRAHIHPRP